MEVRGIRIICSKLVNCGKRSPSSECYFIVNFALAREFPAWPPSSGDEGPHPNVIEEVTYRGDIVCNLRDPSVS